MTKAELRAGFRQQRRALSETDWQTRCEALAARFLASFPPKPGSVLSTFLPIENQKEVNTWLIVRRLWQDFPAVHVAAPVTDLVAGTLEHYAISPETVFTQSRYGIPEPAPNSSFIVHHSSLDVVLIPLLAFDRTGNRVGYGGGFYDRFLSDCRPDCLKIGLSLFDPVDAIEDVYEGDIRLNSCVTPEKVWSFDRNADWTDATDYN